MILNDRTQRAGVAAAVALACGAGVAGVANAATFSTSNADIVTMSSQYVALAASTAVETVTATVTLGVNYFEGDRIKIDVLSGGSFVSNTVALASPSAASGATCSVSAQNYVANTANYRVPAGGTPAGSVCVFTVGVRASTVGATTLQFSSVYQAGDAIEAPISKQYRAVADQFGASVQKVFAGVVDVEKDRYHFVGDDPTTGSLLDGHEMQLHLSITNGVSNIASGKRAAISSVTVTVVGDFSWLDDDGLNTCSAGDVSAGAARAARAFTGLGGGLGAGTWNLTCGASNGTLTYVQAAGADGLSVTSGLVKIALGKAVSNTTALDTSSLGVIEKRIAVPATYTASVAFTYFNPDRGTATTGSVPALSGVSAGGTSLNGSTINVPFLPYGSGVSRVLYLTNRSTQTGGITISAIADGSSTACASFDGGTAKANGVTLLTDKLDAGIAACYGESFTGKVAVTITANTPGANTEVFSAYNRSGSLTTVVNSSNGK